MKENATVITILCSYLCVGEGIKPLQPKEWSKLAENLVKQNLQPSDLLTLTDQDYKERLGYNEEDVARIRRLLDRSGAMSFELCRYQEQGVEIVTRADEGYPTKLKKKLGSQCPPLFYVVGDLSLLQENAIGFVGSRDVGLEDEQFTQKAVATANEKGNIVVSGGAKGVDGISAQASIAHGRSAVEFLSDSLVKKVRSNVQLIQNKQLLLLSAAKPDARFQVGMAMGRNKYIYAQSEATVVVRSDFGKGGTWTGATEAIKQRTCPVLCWDNGNYKGNRELIALGATGISMDWDGSFSPTAPLPPKETPQEPTIEQISLFD